MAQPDLLANMEAWLQFVSTERTGSERGNCYENAARFILDKPEFEGSPVFLFHGMVKHPETGEYHGHAWLQWGDGQGLILDPSNGEDSVSLFPWSDYYEAGGIDRKQVQQYSADVARRMCDEQATYGPWED